MVATTTGSIGTTNGDETHTLSRGIMLAIALVTLPRA
jgi:hypothetical protein